MSARPKENTFSSSLQQQEEEEEPQQQGRHHFFPFSLIFTKMGFAPIPQPANNIIKL